MIKRLLFALLGCSHAEAKDVQIGGVTFRECSCGWVEERLDAQLEARGRALAEAQAAQRHDESAAAVSAKRARDAENRRRAVAAKRSVPAAAKKSEAPTPFRKAIG